MFATSTLSSHTRTFSVLNFPSLLTQVNINVILYALHRSTNSSFSQTQCSCCLYVRLNKYTAHISFSPESVTFLHVTIGLGGNVVRHRSAVFFTNLCSSFSYVKGGKSFRDFVHPIQFSFKALLTSASLQPCRVVLPIFI